MDEARARHLSEQLALQLPVSPPRSDHHVTHLSPVQIPDLSHLLQARLRKLEVVKIASEKFRHEVSTLTVLAASATIVPSSEFNGQVAYR